MAQENNIAQQLNDLLVTRDFHPDMRDSQGKVCDSSEAKMFTFDYVSGSGKDYGTMVIILDSGNDLKAMFGNNLGRGMEDADKDEWYEFQQQLSQFANSHRWTYTGDDISKLKYTMQGLAAIKEGLFEGYYGTRRISYAGEPTQARLMIRHNRNLGENDARFRYVESIFVETADGERHRLPFTNLAGGRAMLEHVRQGGKPYDVRGNHICEMITELKVLARFNRASQGRVVEGVKQSVVQGAQTYYKSLRENIKRLSSPRGYTAYFESWHPASITEQDQLVEDIKTLFIEQTIDDRIEQALPLLAKIQQGREMKEAEIFENWVNSVTESHWNLPETPEQLNRLKELMANELIVGPDGTNAKEQLRDLIGDDDLFNRIEDLAAQDPDANLWDDTDVQDILRALGIQMPDRAAPDMAAQPQPQQTQGVAEGSALSTSTLTGEIPTLMGHRKTEQRDLIEKYALHNREQDYFELFVELSGKPMSEIYNMNDSHQLAYELYNLGSQIAGDWRNISNPTFSRREYLNQIMSDWYNLFKKSIQKYKSMEGDGDHQIRRGMKVSQGTVEKVDGNTVTVKTSNGDMITMNIHDVDQAVAEGYDTENELQSLIWNATNYLEDNYPEYAGNKQATANLVQLAHEVDSRTTPEQLVSMLFKKQGVAEADNIAAFESLQRMRHLSGMKLEEARIEESSEFMYEKIGKTLAQQQPMLDVNSDQFVHAVYDEMIELGMTPKSAKHKLSSDEDFLDDVSNSFHHYVRHQPDGQTVGQVMSQVGTRGLSGRPAPLTECNYTMEGEYCPEHGLSECWSQGMYEDILSTGIQLAEDDKTNEGLEKLLPRIFGNGAKVAGSKMDNLRAVSKYPDAGVQQAGTMTPGLAGKVVSDWEQPLFKSRGPSTPYTPDEQQTVQGVKKQMQSQADKQSNWDYAGPRGSSAPPSPQATRAARTQGAAFDAQNNMLDNQDRMKAAYGIDEDMTDVGDVVGQATRSAHDWLGQEANNIYKPIGNFIKGVKQGWNGKAQTDTTQPAAAVATPVRSPDITTRELPGEPRQTGFDRRVKQPKTDPDTPVRSDDDLDEASYMDPQVVDLTSDNEIARAHELLKQYTNGKADFAANNRQLLARMTGQDKTGAAPGSVAPSFGTPGAAHAGQGGSDYQDEEPKGQAHAGQGGYNYGDETEPNDRRMNDADWIMSQNPDMPKGQAHSGQQGYDYQDEPDQSDAETSRLNRAGKSVDLGLPPGQLDKSAWDDMMKSVPGLDKNAWADLMKQTKVSEADRAQGFTAPDFTATRWSPVGRRGSAGLGPDGQPAPLKNTSAPPPAKTPSFDVTKDPLFRAAMKRIDTDNKGNSRSRYFLPHSDEPVVQPPTMNRIDPDTDIPGSDDSYPVAYGDRDDLGPPVFDQEPPLSSLDKAPRLPNNTVTNVDVTRESREGDALLARIKSLALIR